MPRRKNKLLKPANLEMEYGQFHVEELEKCAVNPIYFIENYVKIIHPTLGAVPFNLYPYQKELIELYWKNKDVIVLSARQTGKCVDEYATVSIVDKNKISFLRKLILKLVNKKVYDQIFGEG